MNLSIRSRIVVSTVILSLALALGFLGTEVISSTVEYPNAYAKTNLLRLHVIANSNSALDQQLKLAVRDAILAKTGELFASAQNKEEAEQIFQAHQKEIELAANKVISEWGKDYGVELEIGNFPFPEKTYGRITLPAGQYDAIRVIIGEGKGHNWWCVLFPPLCVIDVEKGAELAPVKGDAQLGKVPVEFRFRYAGLAMEIGKKILQLARAPLILPRWASGALNGKALAQEVK